MAFRPPVQQTSYIVDSNGDPVYFIDGAIPVSIQSGGGTGGTASDFSSTFPAVGTAAGALDTGGKMAPFELDASGNLNVNVQTGTLSVTVSPTESDTVTAAGPATIGASSVQLLAANSSRKRMTIQNVGTTVLYILFGAGNASSSNYHIALPAGGTANDGSSPIYLDIMWQGRLAAISSSSGGSVSVGEFT